MSIPRYSPNPLWFAIPIVDDKEGKLCEYRDYLKLEAENERLKAEVERLRKAGDAMVYKIPDMMACVVKAEEATGLMNDWIAAKEGKQS